MRALLRLQDAIPRDRLRSKATLLAVKLPFGLRQRLTKVGDWGVPLNRGIAV
jgi:hypothetical protein